MPHQTYANVVANMANNTPDQNSLHSQNPTSQQQQHLPQQQQQQNSAQSFLNRKQSFAFNDSINESVSELADLSLISMDFMQTPVLQTHQSQLKRDMDPPQPIKSNNNQLQELDALLTKCLLDKTIPTDSSTANTSNLVVSTPPIQVDPNAMSLQQHVNNNTNTNTNSSNLVMGNMNLMTNMNQLNEAANLRYAL